MSEKDARLRDRLWQAAQGFGPFQKGQSGNPRTPRGQERASRTVAAELDERVTITINGRRRRMTNREAIARPDGRQIHPRRSARYQDAGRHAKEAEAKAGTGSARAPPQSTTPGKLAVEDREVVELFVGATAPADRRRSGRGRRGKTRNCRAEFQSAAAHACVANRTTSNCMRRTSEPGTIVLWPSEKVVRKLPRVHLISVTPDDAG